MISTIFALPYQLARLPLAFVDERLSDKMSETSIPRVALDRALGTADQFAGTLLRNQDIAGRGTERLHRSRKLVTAAKLEAKADVTRQEAREVATVGWQDAVRKRDAAEERVVTGLREADAEEVQGKQQATATARKAAAAKKAAADKRAQSRANAVDERKKTVATAAAAKKRAAQREAKNELDAVREKKQTAAQKRADAERLGALTEAKKTQRKQQ
ncbi:MAG: hypothetical protein JWQ32_601 [Marmoricola sp.]|nr:hypothetical protein [Marmoricola sp.]